MHERPEMLQIIIVISHALDRLNGRTFVRHDCHFNLYKITRADYKSRMKIFGFLMFYCVLLPLAS